jgi:hypothetical protein
MAVLTMQCFVHALLMSFEIFLLAGREVTTFLVTFDWLFMDVSNVLSVKYRKSIDLNRVIRIENVWMTRTVAH